MKTMKTTLLCTLLLAATICSAQKLSTYIDLGLGDNIEHKFPYYEKKDRGRIAVFVAEYLELNNGFSFGVEGGISGRLFSFIGGSGTSNYEDNTTNTRWLNNNNMQAGTLLINGKYSFKTQKKIKPFVGLGWGTTTYFYNLHVNDISRLSQTSIVFSPEAGVDISRFRIECKAIIGGRTPGYDKTDVNTNQQTILTSISSHQLYLKTGYRLFGKLKK